jgi:hypothetical protein
MAARCGIEQRKRGVGFSGAARLDRGAGVFYKTGPLFTANAQVAQSVEQRTENPRVGGSIPPLGTIKINDLVESRKTSRLGGTLKHY